MTSTAVVRISGQQDGEGNLARIGAAVRQRRLACGMSQEALADAASIDRSHMGKIERGERNVTLLNVIKISAALGWKPSELLAAAEL